MIRTVFILTGLFVVLPAEGQPAGQGAAALPFAPNQYVVYRTDQPLSIDGKPAEDSWLAAPWTSDFVDIEGDAGSPPRFRTRAKMLWDETYFYVAAELEEPHLWATLTERDTVIFYDDDFEIFIDPDGDTHAYYELEFNAFATIWDLMLIKPYRDGGPAVDGWDVRDLAVGVHVEGTLNEPGDTDQQWTVEVAIPWTAFNEIARDGQPPEAGTQWRVNFSRVEWQVDVEEGRYVKKIDPETGTPFPEANWVWSPQGAVNMHRPERWGYVQFSDVGVGEGTEAFVEDPNERVKWALRLLYYRQQAYFKRHGVFADALRLLNAAEIIIEGIAFEPSLEATTRMYQITAPGFNGTTIHIRHDGKVWEDS